MTPFDFHCPTRIVFGPGRMAELGELTSSLGVKRVLVVSDPGIEEVGHTQRGVESLQSAGLETHIFDGLQENPTTDNVDAGLAVAKDYRPDVIIAIGGGSSMDCAKGVNFLYSCGGRMQDYWGVGKATANMLPMVAVPTTAGTGSEAQSFALISDAETHVKMACGDKRAAFRIALLDPELTLTQPASVAALTSVDAISHAIESRVTKKRNKLSVTMSKESWRLLARGFERVFGDALAHGGSHLEGRAELQLGACFAGLAIENSMLGAAHALANPLTASYSIPHGQAVGVMLPHVIRHNSQDEEAAAAYHDCWRELGDRSLQDDGEAAEMLASGLAVGVGRTGLKTDLRSLGVDQSSIPELAAQAAKQWTGTFNPVEMTAEDYQRLYEAAH